MNFEERLSYVEKQTIDLTSRTENLEKTTADLQNRLEDIETIIDNLKRSILKRQVVQLNYKPSNGEYEKKYLTETANLQKELKQLMAKRIR